MWTFAVFLLARRPGLSQATAGVILGPRTQLGLEAMTETASATLAFEPFMAIGASSPALLMTHVPGVVLPRPGKGTIPGQFSTPNYERDRPRLVGAINSPSLIRLSMCAAVRPIWFV